MIEIALIPIKNVFVISLILMFHVVVFFSSQVPNNGQAFDCIGKKTR